jgi:hypothetical protein
LPRQLKTPGPNPVGSTEVISHARTSGAGVTVEAPEFFKALVRPDDTVTFGVDDGSALIEYLGL